MKDQERYYQSIARLLFSLRGAPFVLSSREIEAVKSWEAAAIPLATVLEGIRQAYGVLRGGRGRRGRKLTLVTCHPHVLQAYAQLRDRAVGGDTRRVTLENKCREIGRAVREFLEGLPPAVQGLSEIFVGLQEDLARGACDPERLESLDESIEERLFGLATDADLARLAEELHEEHGVVDREELSRLVRIKWVKSLRERYKVPHVSPFYY